MICEICYDNFNNDLLKCIECKNKLCIDCFIKLSKYTKDDENDLNLNMSCPFCRCDKNIKSIMNDFNEYGLKKIIIHNISLPNNKNNNNFYDYNLFKSSIYTNIENNISYNFKFDKEARELTNDLDHLLNDNKYLRLKNERLNEKINAINNIKLDYERLKILYLNEVKYKEEFIKTLSKSNYKYDEFLKMSLENERLKKDNQELTNKNKEYFNALNAKENENENLKMKINKIMDIIPLIIDEIKTVFIDKYDGLIKTIDKYLNDRFQNIAKKHLWDVFFKIRETHNKVICNDIILNKFQF